jgi:hypothetical protein
MVATKIFGSAASRVILPFPGIKNLLQRHRRVRWKWCRRCSVHDGCIKWIAVHLSKPKGYILSWYGGTIRLMLNRERAGSIARMFTLHFAG